MEMWSLFNSKKINEILNDVMSSDYEWTIWQTSTQGRIKYSAKLSSVQDSLTNFDLVQGDAQELKTTEAIFAHCSKRDIIFKRDKFSVEGQKVSFKTPVELKLREKRLSNRFNFKYQDFKLVIMEQNEEVLSRTLLDLSNDGLSFACSAQEALKHSVGDRMIVKHITDQDLGSGHDCEIVYNERFHGVEGLADRTNNNVIFRIGVKFTQALESVTYKSISSILEKKQEKSKGIITSGFNGVNDDDQQRILRKISEDNRALASNISDRIEEIDRLKFLTKQMKQQFWLEVNQELLSAALRLSSKELIYELLIDISDTMREEFLEKLDVAKPPSAINKAQDEICKFIKNKERTGEFVLDPKSFVQYV